MQMPVSQSIVRDLAERQEQSGTGCCVGVHMHREPQAREDRVQASRRAEESLGDPCSRRTGGNPGESPASTARCQLLGCLPNGTVFSAPDWAAASIEEPEEKSWSRGDQGVSKELLQSPACFCPATPTHPAELRLG